MLRYYLFFFKNENTREQQQYITGSRLQFFNPKHFFCEFREVVKWRPLLSILDHCGFFFYLGAMPFLFQKGVFTASAV